MDNPLLNTIVPVLITLLTPFVVQLLKGTNLTGGAALVLTFAVSTVAALLAALVSNTINLPSWTGDPAAYLQELGTLVSVVFTIATIIYKGIIKATGVGMSAAQRTLAARQKALDERGAA